METRIQNEYDFDTLMRLVAQMITTDSLDMQGCIRVLEAGLKQATFLEAMEDDAVLQTDLLRGK